MASLAVVLALTAAYLLRPMGTGTGPVPTIAHYPNGSELEWEAPDSTYASAGAVAIRYTFRTFDSAARVLGFYRDEMPKLGWLWENTGYRQGRDKTLYFRYTLTKYRSASLTYHLQITAEYERLDLTKVTILEYHFK